MDLKSEVSKYYLQVFHLLPFIILVMVFFRKWNTSNNLFFFKVQWTLEKNNLLSKMRKSVFERDWILMNFAKNIFSDSFSFKLKKK